MGNQSNTCFSNTPNFTTLNIGSYVTNIPDYAFYGCWDNLRGTLNINATNIGKYAFYHCRYVTGLTLGSLVRTIGEYAFQGCSGLTGTLNLNYATAVGKYAFYNCNGLTGLTLGSSLTTIGDCAFLQGGTYYYFTSVTNNRTIPQVINTNIFNSDTYNRATLYVTSTAYCTATGWKDFRYKNGLDCSIAVTGVTLNKTAITLGVGGKEQLIETVQPSNADNQNVSWSSSNSSVATVYNGLVTAVAVGTATITVTTQDGNKTAQCVVTVTPPVAVTGVTLNKTTTTLQVGNTEQLTETVQPSNATNKTVSWSSSNPSVATVSYGYITAVETGTATITVTTQDGNKTAQCVVTVTPAPVAVTGITLNKSTTTLAIGTTEQLIPVVTPSNATNQTVSWSSSNTSVATVSNGLVTALSTGVTIIYATTQDGGRIATCIVTVIQLVTGLSLDKNTTSLKLGGSSEWLTATIEPTNATNNNVTWNSGDENVVTVSGGLISAVALGTAVITAINNDNGNIRTAQCVVTVTQGVTGVSLNQPSEIFMAIGGTKQLTATVAPANAANQTVSWSSDNPSFATVSNGLITAIAAGSTYITVTTQDGNKTDWCKVTVVNKIRYVKPAAAGTGDGSSWANASGNIQAMINASAYGDHVWIAAGNYNLTATLTMKNGVKLYGGFAGTETSINDRAKSDLDANGTIEEWEFTNATVLNGQNTKRVIDASSVSSSVSDGFTITGGNTTADGGGVYLNTINTLKNSIIKVNTASGNGGGVYSDGGTVSYCLISGNTATHGGGIFSLNGTVTNCRVTGTNTATNHGGGIYNNGGETNYCTVSGNTATNNGGGIFNLNGGTVRNCLIAKNTANYGGGTVNGTLTNCTLVENKANTSNGGVYQAAGNTATLVNCIVWGNTAPAAGQLTANSVTYTAVQGGATGTGNINLAAGNTASGGPLFIDPTAGNYKLQNGSPCINKGSNAVITAGETDLAGNTRIFDGTVDMGAYENLAIAVTGITLNKSETMLAIFSKEQLIHTITPSNATNQTVTWSSSAPSVATVSNGLVTAVAAGTATITVTTVDGSKTAQCVVTVTSQTECYSIYTNDIASSSGWTLSGVTWNSANNGQLVFATKDSYAIMPALSAGNTNMQITISARFGDYLYLYTSPDNATYTNQERFTGSSSIATASKPLPNGTRYVKFVAASGTINDVYLISVNVDVCPVVSVTGVTLNKSTTTLAVGGTEQLSHTVQPAAAANKAVSWSSSNPSVAVVSDGLIIALSAGTATITVTTKDGNKTAQCVVTVTVPVAVTGVSLNKTSTSLAVGNTEQLTETVQPAAATNKTVSWSSSNTSVAIVSDGLVLALSAGTATITVTTKDGNKTAQCVVTVTAAPVAVTGVTLNKTSTSLVIGTTEQLIHTVQPSNATDKTVSWSSSNISVATVSNGLITAKAAGTSTITVTTQDGNKTATCIVTVNGSSGIDDVLANSIIIYPNPTNYELKITNYDGEIKNVEICDLSGRTVEALRATPLQGAATINVSTLPQGIYLVKIYTDKGVVTKRFVKM